MTSSEKDTCLNPFCFQAKTQSLVQIKKAEIETKSGKPAAYISPYYSPNEVKDALGTGDYRVLEKKADRCEFAEQAVYAEGQQIGQGHLDMQRQDVQRPPRQSWRVSFVFNLSRRRKQQFAEWRLAGKAKPAEAGDFRH